MKVFTTLLRAMVIVVVGTLIMGVIPAFGQIAPEAIDSAGLFIGTWDSVRTNLCGPCTLKIDGFDKNGKALGLLTTDPSGVTTLNGSLKINSKGKVVLAVVAPLGTYFEFALPKPGGNKIYAVFPNGSDLEFKRKV